MDDYTANSYQGDHNAQSDLQNMEDNFETLRSSFSKATPPTSVSSVAGMAWFDTTKKLLRLRNNANSAWNGIMWGDADQKMLVYRNAAMDGWAIDTSVTDRVVAIKGGSTYTTGGAVAGSWTLPGHTLTAAQIPAHKHPASELAVDGVAVGSGGLVIGSGETGENTGGGGSHNHGATYRPAAAVVTIQYVDI